MRNKEEVFMIILKEGKMTNNELAEWFNISAASFRNKKKEKLEELKEYADFREDKGKIIITEVWNAGPYIKKKSKAYQIVKESFDEEWNENGLDTCSNVSNKIYEKHQDELAITPTTTYTYTLATRAELYGKPFIGNCYYVWCKKFETKDGTIVLEEFNEEEQEIKKKLLQKYFATDVERDLMIHEMVMAKEITKAEAYDLSCELRNLKDEGFIGFKKELEAVLGCSIVKGTKIDKGNYIGFGEQLALNE